MHVHAKDATLEVHTRQVVNKLTAQHIKTNPTELCFNTCSVMRLRTVPHARCVSYLKLQQDVYACTHGQLRACRRPLNPTQTHLFPGFHLPRSILRLSEHLPLEPLLTGWASRALAHGGGGVSRITADSFQISLHSLHLNISHLLLCSFTSLYLGSNRPPAGAYSGGASLQAFGSRSPEVPTHRTSLNRLSFVRAL
jgi:hypothetical protein